jgi:YD repeat-containing protein
MPDNAEGHTTRFEYDAMNRRTAVIDATGKIGTELFLVPH